MVKAEKAFKWGIAIIIIFGTLNAFYFLNLVIALKIALPVLCVFLIGSILLQSGKGGGLAGIGGLGDQAAFGTRTSSFLTQVTYLIGAAFLVATIFLFKLSVSTQQINTIARQEQHSHEAHEHQDHGDEFGGPGHAAPPHPQEQKQTTGQAGGLQEIQEEQQNGQAHENFHHRADENKSQMGKSMGMSPSAEEANKTTDTQKEPPPQKQTEADQVQDE